MKMAILLLLILFPSCFFGQGVDSLLYKNKDLKIYVSKGLFKNDLLYDAQKDFNELAKLEGDCAVGYQYYYTPISLIGEYLSFEKVEVDMGAGNGDCSRPPGRFGKILSINVRTKDTISILNLVDEQSLIRAIQQDSYILNNEDVNIQGLDSCKTFKDILKVINYFMNNNLGENFTETSFGILGYNRKTERLAVRLIGLRYTGFNHYEYVQLGLLVKPLPHLKKEINKGNVFYMGTYKSLFLKK